MSLSGSATETWNLVQYWLQHLIAISCVCVWFLDDFLRIFKHISTSYSVAHIIIPCILVRVGFLVCSTFVFFAFSVVCFDFVCFFDFRYVDIVCFSFLARMVWVMSIYRGARQAKYWNTRLKRNCNNLWIIHGNVTVGFYSMSRAIAHITHNILLHICPFPRPNTNRLVPCIDAEPNAFNLHCTCWASIGLTSCT